MAFVHVGGSSDAKPTYFEVVASDRLVPSLKAAVVYALSVLSQRHPWIHRLLDYEDEVLALVVLLVDWHSLATSDATFSEGLYGLRRRPLNASQGHDVISKCQRRLALVTEVILPYLRAKADRLYRLYTNQGVLGLALGRSGHASSAQAQGLWHRAKLGLLQGFVHIYPYVHAALEGSVLAWHVAYLLGHAPSHSPVLQGLGMHLARVSAEDLKRQERQTAAARHAAQLATRIPGRHPVIGTTQRALLTAAAFVSDHSRSALILAVFGFKALEWWFTSAEARLAAGKAVPPPPPPPPRAPAKGGVGLPEERSHCPLCRKPCTSPAQLSCSGYVYCYQCVFGHVLHHGVCPVTLLPATLDHVRKLYADA